MASVTFFWPCRRLRVCRERKGRRDGEAAGGEKKVGGRMVKGEGEGG